MKIVGQVLYNQLVTSIQDWAKELKPLDNTLENAKANEMPLEEIKRSASMLEVLTLMVVSDPNDPDLPQAIKTATEMVEKE